MNALISLHFPAHPFLRDRLTAVIGCRWQLCSTRDNEFQWGRREKRTSQSSLSAATYFVSFKGAFEMAASARQMTGNSFNPPIFFFFLFVSFFLPCRFLHHPSAGWILSLFFPYATALRHFLAVVVVVVVWLGSVVAFHLFLTTWHFPDFRHFTYSGKSVRTAIQSGAAYKRERDWHISRIFSKSFLMNTNKRRMMMMMNQLRGINTHPKTDFRLERGVCFLFKKKKRKEKNKTKQKDKLQTDETLIINTLKNLRNANENKSLNKERGHLIKSSSFQGLPDIHNSVEEI